jgi:hypothetical protein
MALQPFERKRSRKLPLYWDKSEAVTNPSGVGGSVSRSKIAEGSQVTVSQSHPIDRRTGHRVGGGPFYTSRSTYFVKPGRVSRAYWGGAGKYFSGPLYPTLPTTEDLNKVGFTNLSMKLGSEDLSAMTTYGATAIARSSPVNPVSQLGVSLLEVTRDGLPSVHGVSTWKDRTLNAKNAGDEYLNHVFGWEPLVSEINDVGHAARRHRDIMLQYDAGAGRDTHRGYEFPLESSSNSVERGPTFLNGCDPHFTKEPSQMRTVSLVKETKRWFEGCFTYAMPSSIDSWQKHIDAGKNADQLFGLRLTPSLLWEAAPWSWAVDWFSNAGDVIQNVTNMGAAGQVMRYGYIMEESIERVTVEASPQRYYSDVKTNGVNEVMSDGCSCGFEIVTKRRSSANPFGFGLTWEGLSPTQLAITAALGITKLL